MQWRGRILNVICRECCIPPSLTPAAHGTTQALQLPQSCSSNSLQQTCPQRQPCNTHDPPHPCPQSQPCCSPGRVSKGQQTPTDEPASKPEDSTSYIIIVSDPGFPSDNSTASPGNTCSPHLLEIAVETVD